MVPAPHLLRQPSPTDSKFVMFSEKKDNAVLALARFPESTESPRHDRDDPAKTHAPSKVPQPAGRDRLPARVAHRTRHGPAAAGATDPAFHALLHAGEHGWRAFHGSSLGVGGGSSVAAHRARLAAGQPSQFSRKMDARGTFGRGVGCFGRGELPAPAAKRAAHASRTPFFGGGLASRANPGRAAAGSPA